MRYVFKFGLLILVLGSITGSPLARAENPTREFVMSCTYGVLAGTLVGAASLAFTSQPSKNMHRVARGASLGLYTGILLGLYVVYLVPSGEEGDDATVAWLNASPVTVSPLFLDSNDLDGVQVDWTVWKF